MRKTKLISAITLLVFFTVTLSTLIAGLIIKNKIQPEKIQTQTNNQKTLGISNQANPVSVILTPAEVAKHKNSSDCWMIISGNVYNFTRFIPEHPGGSIMVPFCGKDATIAYQTMGGRGRSHSQRADSLMGNYFLGNLNSSVDL